MSFCLGAVAHWSAVQTNTMYIKNEAMDLILIDGLCYLSCPKSNALFIIEDLSDLLIDIIFFCLYPRQKTQILAFLSNHIKDTTEAEPFFETMLGIGLIVPSELRQDHSKDFFDHDLKRYLQFRYSVVHADYSMDSVYIEDKIRMESFLDSKDYPSLSKEYPKPSYIQLYHPAYGYKPATAQAKLSCLLFFAFGRLRTTVFLDFLPIILKCVPSKGCRHVFDVYIIDIYSEFFNEGAYYYDPLDHRLSKVNFEEDFGFIRRPTKGAIGLFIMANFERHQWRYRHSWSYKDIFFDLGHVVETMKYTAQHLGLDIINPILLEGNPTKIFLKEDCFYQCEIRISCQN